MMMITPAELGVPPDAQLVDFDAVAQITGHGKRTIERWISMGIFPQPLPNPYSNKRVWRLSAVIEWTRNFGNTKLP